jgi:phosphatidylglycerophosphatase A
VSSATDTGARWIATWFGVGLAPRAPGTLGSIAALPLYWVLERGPSAALPIAVVLVTAIGVWSGQRVATSVGDSDPQIVVIDEVAGVLLALWLAGGGNWMVDLLALVLFRVFDIFKPWPIGALERLKPAGVGIMADDIGAGLVAGLIAAIIAWWL